MNAEEPHRAPGYEATVYILYNDTVSFVWHHGQYVDMFYVLFCHFFCVGLFGHNRLPLGEILSLSDSQERLCGLENPTRAYIDMGVSRKWGRIRIILSELSL